MDNSLAQVNQINFKNLKNCLSDHKVFGGILLILGTCLGGAILALPISNAYTGFGISSIYLLSVWAVMTFCSILILEVNLLFKPGTNLLTMSKETLGITGQIVTGLSYFLLLYNLLSAYISGGSGIILSIVNLAGINLTETFAAIVFVIIFGLIVFSRMHRLDIVNRALILVKLILFLLIILFSFRAISFDGLIASSGYYSKGILMVLSTSFGFGVIIPSLRVYLDSDPFKLRVAVIMGAFIPLIVYLVWDLVLMGSIGTEMQIGRASCRERV